MFRSAAPKSFRGAAGNGRRGGRFTAREERQTKCGNNNNDNINSNSAITVPVSSLNDARNYAPEAFTAVAAGRRTRVCIAELSRTEVAGPVDALLAAGLESRGGGDAAHVV